MDNASFHRSNVVLQRLSELQITRIMNVPYSPEYNPIEGCFSIVKSFFKRQRLNAMLNNKSSCYNDWLCNRFVSWQGKRSSQWSFTVTHSCYLRARNNKSEPISSVDSKYYLGKCDGGHPFSQVRLSASLIYSKVNICKSCDKVRQTLIKSI